MNLYQIIQTPRVTEKATDQKTAFGQVTFKVHPNSNRIEIRKAVEALFNVKVVSVRTMNVRGKRRRMGRTSGKRPDWKKAVVQLAPGENIQFFEGV